MKIFEGQKFTHEHEEKAKQKILGWLDSLTKELNLPIIPVFSFSVQGVDFDCVLFTEFFIIIVEFKSWKTRIAGKENSYWSYVYPNGESKEIITNRNPYQQVLTCRSKLTGKLLGSGIFGIKRENLSELISAGIVTYPRFDIDKGIGELCTRNPWFYIESLEEIGKIIIKNQVKHKNRVFELRILEKFVTAALGCQIANPPVVQKIKQITTSQAEGMEQKRFNDLVKTDMNRNLIVRAVPGSGKTKFIIERVRYLIAEKGVEPARIGIVTYANEASNEIQKRLLGECVVKTENELFSCGTIHSLCYKIVGQWYSELGYQKNPVVINEGKAAGYFDHSLTVKTGTYVDEIFEIFKIIINKNLIEIGEIENFLNEYHPGTIRAQDFSKICNDYFLFLQKKSAICFDSMLMFCNQLLDRKEVINKLKQRLNFLLVDEYQDISRIQFEIFKKLSYCAALNFVGDPHQAIYSFRGATATSFNWAEKEIPEMKEKTMQFNHRSGVSIIDFLNDFKKNVYVKEENDLKIFPVRKELGMLHFREFQSQREEAKYISSEIKKYLDNGISLSDIAVLYRSRKLRMDPIKELINFFKKEDILYVSKVKFKDKPHIAKALSFLDAVFTDNFDESHLFSLCNIDPRCTREMRTSIEESFKNGITVDGLTENIKKKNNSLTGSLIMKMLYSIRNAKGKNINEAIKLFYLDIYPVLKNIVPDECEESDFYKLFEIGEEFNNYGDFSKRINLEFVEESPNGVVISSIHSAKGREWKVVFVVGIIDGLIPDERSTSYEENDEKNVLYVAITRAKDILHLVYAKKINFKEKKLSSYLDFARVKFQ